MPAPLLSRDEVLDRLLATFRTHGYDGASLSVISDATGLGRSSLYHYFPGGKVEMGRAVLAHLDAKLATEVFPLLRTDAAPPAKLDAFLRALDAFYDRGRQACLLERLTASVDHRAFQRPLARTIATLQGALADLGLEAGVPPALAAARAEDAVVRIEGALVVAAATGHAAVWSRTLAALRAELFAPG